MNVPWGREQPNECDRVHVNSDDVSVCLYLCGLCEFVIRAKKHDSFTLFLSLSLSFFFLFSLKEKKGE